MNPWLLALFNSMEVLGALGILLGLCGLVLISAR